MSKLLRHTPEEYGLALDAEDGSCPVNALLQTIQKQPRWAWVRHEDIEQVVRQSDKQRYELTQGRIKARYGHSKGKIRYEKGEPPAILFHGTNRQALPSIMETGLLPMGRQYVHLSEGTHFASLAGSRRGALVMLQVDTILAKQAGVVFYYAGNEVWLAESVPRQCCSLSAIAGKEMLKDGK